MGRRALPHPLTIHHRNTEQKEHTMKRTILAAGLALGLVIAGASAPAFATPPEECIPTDAWTEVVPDIEHAAVTEVIEHPATYETVVITPAVEYQAAVYEVEYEFRHKHDGKKVKWSTNPNWNAEQNDHSKGWYATGNTRDGALITPEVLAQDEVTEERLLTEAYTETVIITEAYTEVVEDIEHPAVVCEEPPVIVEPTIAGTAWSGTCEDNFGGFSYAVTVGSENGARAFQVKSLGDGTGGTAETFYRADGTTGAPGEVITFATVEPGESATFTLDGLTPGNYRVVSDGTQKVKAAYRFDFTVTDAGECPIVIEPPVEEPPVVVQPVVTPPVVAPPVVAPVAPAPAPLAAQIVADGVGGDEPTTLAQTGGGVSPLVLGGGALALLAGAALLIRRRITA